MNRTIGRNCFAAIAISILGAGGAIAEVKVGAILPLSGSYSPIGADNQQGIEVALELLGERNNLKFVYADSRGDPTTGISEFRKITQDEGVVAAYAMRGPVGMALNPVSNAMKFPLLGGVGNIAFARGNRFAFQLWSNSEVEGAFIAERLGETPNARIAILSSQDDWLVAISSGVKERLTTLKMAPVFDEEISPGEKDFRTILSRVRQRKANVVFLNLAVTQIGPFLKQAKEAEIRATLYSNFWLPKQDVLDAAGEQAVEGVMYAEMDTDLPKLREALRRRFNSSPSGATVSAFMATFLINQAVAATGKEAPSVTEVYQALLEQPEIVTPDRRFEVKERAVQFPLVLKVMRNGKPSVIDSTKTNKIK